MLRSGTLLFEPAVLPPPAAPAGPLPLVPLLLLLSAVFGVATQHTDGLLLLHELSAQSCGASAAGAAKNPLQTGSKPASSKAWRWRFLLVEGIVAGKITS